MPKTAKKPEKNSAEKLAKILQKGPAAIAGPLLRWFEANKRALPFRLEPTPYRIWVSEIMLQQTQVATALPYYHRFIAALPDAAALAACDEDRLHKLWEGLGYYSRVRNMQKAARVVVEQYGGQLPADYAALLKLPGIGAYTAGAIAAIAFGLPEVAVDGNVLRVASRLLAYDGDVMQPAVRSLLTEVVQLWQPAEQPGPFNEAVMELGALVCTPASPSCGACPLASLCNANREGCAAQLPVKAKAKAKVEEDFTVLVVQAGEGVLLHRRPARGLLAGLWEPPLLAGQLAEAEAQAQLAALVPGAEIVGALPKAKHIFTHRVWQMGGWLCTAPADAVVPGEDYAFATREGLLAHHAVPGAFKAYLPYLAGLAPIE
ncbi:MAG: A/G-specific adenine glycosylase [Ruminococcaceae bacterium]|mgnify:CR=1 FL=1|nr:A/G-specific adenine glycosylase [Oscillospiraceae bacterium]